MLHNWNLLSSWTKKSTQHQMMRSSRFSRNFHSAFPATNQYTPTFSQQVRYREKSRPQKPFVAVFGAPSSVGAEAALACFGLAA
jgi:hypothetical protein